MGLSSGGMESLKILFRSLPAEFKIPIVIVQHLSPLSDSKWIGILDQDCSLKVKEADEKEKIKEGFIYIAPPNYHLLIENDFTFTLTAGERVSYARPSIDVLFESAAEVVKNELIGVVLTGSNHDGAAGLKQIKDCGGLGIVQDPTDAISSFMPDTARKTAHPDYVLPLRQIIALLNELDKESRE